MMTNPRRFDYEVIALNWLKDNIECPRPICGWRLKDPEVQSLADKLMVMVEEGKSYA